MVGMRLIIAWQTVLIGAEIKGLSLLHPVAIYGRGLITATRPNSQAAHIIGKLRAIALL